MVKLTFVVALVVLLVAGTVSAKPVKVVERETDAGNAVKAIHAMLLKAHRAREPTRASEKTHNIKSLVGHLHKLNLKKKLDARDAHTKAKIIRRGDELKHFASLFKLVKAGRVKKASE